MQVLANYQPLRDIPHYLPCLHTAIYDRLRHAGIPVSLSLFQMLNLHGVPSYSYTVPDQETGARNRFINYSRTDSLGYGELTDYLGFDAASHEAESFEQGLELIRNSLAEDKPFLIFGAMYHLPFSKHYMSQEYLAKRLESFHGAINHWFTIYGLGEDEALVNDPIPQNYLGPLSLEALEKFWKGDRWIPELTGRLEYEEAYWTYGYGEVRIERHLSQDELFELSVSALKTTVHEYLEGRIADTSDEEGTGELHFFGKSAYAQLCADMERMLAEGADKADFAPYDECLFNLRYPHFFMQNMLNDLPQLYGGRFAELPQMYAPFVTETEKIGNMFRMSMMRKSQDVQFVSRTLEKVEALAEGERLFYEHVLDLLANVPLLARPERAEER